MFSDYFNIVMQNKILLSSVVGLVTLIIYYINNRKKENPPEFMDYMKLFLIVTILNYISFHLVRTKEIQKEANYSTVNIGEPEF